MCATLAVFLIGATSTACVNAGSAVTRTREDVGELSERARFCFALARAIAAVESSSPATVREAAEEVLAQAPPELRKEAREVIDALEEARARGDRELRDPRLRTAVERLRDAAANRCDPTRQEGAS